MTRALRSRAPLAAQYSIAALVLCGALSPAVSAGGPASAPARASAARGATIARPAALRDASSLPRFSAAPGDVVLAKSLGSLVLSNSFQNLDGSCNPRGWFGEDRTTQTFMQVGPLVTNRPLYAGFKEFGVVPAPVLPLSEQRLISPGPIAVGDSGQVFMMDVGGLFLAQMNVLYPSANVIRTFGPFPGSGSFGFMRSAAFDPFTRGVVVQEAGNIYRYPAGGGSATKLVGNMSGSTADTTAAWASLYGVMQVACDDAGNIYWTEEGPRVRMLRQNDSRVVTLAGVGGTGPSLASAQGIAVSPDGSKLWVSGMSSIIRIDNPRSATPTSAVEASYPFGEPPQPNWLELSAGRLYTRWDRTVYEVVAGALVPRAGTTDAYATVAQANDALKHHFQSIDEFASDRLGGLYVSDATSHLVVHLKTDGTIEKTAGVPYGVSMGTKALRVGADAASNPEEVANWVQTSGYGNNWSQRLVSPPIDFTGHATAIFRFDVTLDMDDFIYAIDEALYANSKFVAVQVESIAGQWRFIPSTSVYSIPFGASEDLGRAFIGRGSFKVVANLAGTGVHRLRIVVQTSPTTSSEDGLAQPSSAAAVIDNISLMDGSTPITPAVDFEDGTMGGWSAEAYNGTVTDLGVRQYSTRDGVHPGTEVDIASSFDFSDPSCVFKFTSAAGHVENQTLARLTSPWMPTFAPGGVNSGINLVFNGKFPTRNTGKTMSVWMRGKNAGDTRPRFSSPTFFTLFSNFQGTDLAAPFVTDRVVGYPGDFQTPANCDSVQFYFLVEDRYEQFASDSIPPDRVATKLPYLDDIRVIANKVDTDGDGVPDVVDACPNDPATGEDANRDGCVDATATLHHVESWTNDHRPIRYHYSSQNIALFGGANLYAAYDSAFAAWTGVSGASVPAVKMLPLAQGVASAMDGVNLITIGDDSYPFSPEVLAITPTLSTTQRAAYDDAVQLPGTILDADILFNPHASLGLPGHPGDYDLRSVATHEVGHLLGLSHSGVSDATMYFVQLPGTLASTLSPDDMGAVSAAYPNNTALAAFGAIKGRVLRDTVTVGNAGVPGALVTAVQLDGAGAPLDTVASDYTREDGSYALYRLPPGNYGVHIQALDGSVLNGLTPNYISQRLFDISPGRPFEPEWYSATESALDDPAQKLALAVTAANTLTGINVITTLDTQSVAITATSPATGATGVGIDAAIQVNFSEAVNSASLKSAFHLVVQDSATGLAGNGLLSNYGRRFVFSPEEPFSFSTTYTVTLGTQLTDLNGVPLPAPYAFSFTTQAQPPLSITNMSPRQAAPGAYVTVTGAGFVPGNGAVATLARFFLNDAPNDSMSPTLITPTSMVVRIPPTAPAGAATIRIEQSTLPAANGALKAAPGGRLDISNPPSNSFSFTVLPRAQQPSPVALGGAIALGWAPSDIAVSPDGNMVYVVGDGGFSTIRLGGTSGGALRTAVSRSTHKSNSIALSPDGARAFITQTVDSQIVVVDADPGSGGFGSTLGTIRVEGAPGDVVVMASNFRAYATDATDSLLHEFDVRPLSGTVYTELRKLTFAAGPGRQIAAHPQGDKLLISTATGAWTYFLLSGAPDVGAQIDAVGGIGISPDGSDVIAAAGYSGLNRFGPFYPTGGYARDVVVTPQGQSALVANESLNRLQVMSINPADSASYLRVVGYQTTGSSPVSLALGANGSLIAVANRGSHDVSLFGIPSGGVPSLVRAMPDVASPGDLVGLAGDATSAFASVSHVDLGSGVTPATYSAGSAVGFRVPTLSQRSTQVVVERPDSTRTLALPFSVVDPLTTFAPRVIHTFQVRDTICPSVAVVGALSHVRVSADGRVLGVIRESGTCNVSLDLFNIARDGPTPFGALIGSCFVDAPASSRDILDFAFAQDGKHAWIADNSFGVRVIDVDPSSPQFGFFVGAFGVSEHVLVKSLAVDPLGRFIAIGSTTGTVNGVGVYMPNTGFIANLASMPTTAQAVTGDGRYLLCADDAVHVIDTNGYTLAFTSINYSTLFGAGIPTFRQLCVSANGRRALGHFGFGSGLVVLNTDPAAGTVGSQVFAGWPAGMTHANFRRLIPAPDGKSIIAGGHASNDSLYIIDISVNPPTYRAASIGFAPITLARSNDGRTLFASTAGTGAEFGSDARLYALTLTEADAMTLETGPGQGAGPGELLPLPVQVRVTGPQGRPEMGAAVKFLLTSASQGSIDGTPDRSVIHVTDANGETSVRWRLPASGTPQMQITGLGIAGASAAVTANVTLLDSQIEPMIVSLSPLTGESGLNAETPVGVRFNQDMQPAVTSHIELRANGNPVQGTFHLQENGRFVLFQPAQPLPYLAACDLTVTAGALDTDGQALATGGTTAFTVQGPPAVAISAINPPAGPAGASITLNGSGFSTILANNTVLLNGTPATVTQATLASLTAVVPLAATSGPLTVTVNSSTSPGVNYIVLPKNPVLGGAVGELPATQGIRDMVITPDGTRAYVTNPSLNTVSALDLVAANTITSITVGLRPQGIAILPSPLRAYVANTASNSVSVIDIDPASSNYHKVVDNIPVGSGPVDVYFAGAGPKMYVLNGGTSTVSVIDVHFGNATFDQVVATVNTGSAATSVVVSADGSTAYVATAAGLQIIDIVTNTVVATVNTGSAATSVVVSADGTLAFVLTSGGQMVVISLANGANHNKVVATVNTGSAATSVVVSADGSLAYVTDGAGNTITAFAITTGAGSAASTVLPTAPLKLTPLATFPVGQSPTGAAVDPLGRVRLYVVNSGSGTISVFGTPDALPVIPVGFVFSPGVLNLKSAGKSVTGYLYPPSPFLPGEIVVSSIRLGGSLGVDMSHPPKVECQDANGDAVGELDPDELLGMDKPQGSGGGGGGSGGGGGVSAPPCTPALKVKFDRAGVQLLLPVGDHVPVCVSGKIANRNFLGCDTIEVKRGHVLKPHLHELVQAGQICQVEWDSPNGANVQWVAVLHLMPRDPAWTLDAVNVPNSGHYNWVAPNTSADSVRLALVFVTAQAGAGGDSALVVDGVLAMSDPFTVIGNTDVEAAPLALNFAPVLPNPALGAAHLRFGLPARAIVTLEIFDVAGRRVKTVVNGVRDAGWHSVEWKGDGEGAGRLGAGLYYARFRANGTEFRHSFVLLH